MGESVSGGLTGLNVTNVTLLRPGNFSALSPSLIGDG